MKTIAISLAVAAASGVAHAQHMGGSAPTSSSSVEIFGILDTMIQRSSTSNASTTRLSSSGGHHSRLGFRGAENLGDGYWAGFWLEGGVNIDTGTGINSNTNNQASGIAAAGGAFAFNRRSTVSLGSPWGEVRLGREQVPHFWNYALFDPFGYAGIGATQLRNSLGAVDPSTITGIYASNAISYLTPRGLGGFFGQVMHYRGENPSSAGVMANDGNGSSLRAGYANGPLSMAVGAAHKNLAAGDIKSVNLVGSWDFGTVRAMAIYTDDSFGTVDGKGFQLGAIYRVGAGEIKGSLGRYQFDTGATNPAATKLSVGYVHNLSKRTAIYTTYARVQNKGGSTASVSPSALASTGANTSSSGFDIGIRHAF